MGLYICLYQVAKYFVWLVVIIAVVGANMFTSKQPQRRRQCLHNKGISWILGAPCFPFGSIVARILIKFSEMFSCSEKNRKRKTHHTETTECFLWCDILDSSSAFALMQDSISSKATAKAKRFLIIPLWKSINMTWPARCPNQETGRDNCCHPAWMSLLNFLRKLCTQ